MDNTIDSSYKAAGVLLFGAQGQIYMGVDKKSRLCDFGGKRESRDDGDPIKTATRECLEECSVYPILTQSNSIYLDRSKYYLYFAFTAESPTPNNEIREIRSFDSFDNIRGDLNPRLWGSAWKNGVREWLRRSFQVSPVITRRSNLRVVWQSPQTHATA